MRLAVLRAGALAAALFATAAHAAAPPLSGVWKMQPLAKAPKPVLTPKAAAAAAKSKVKGDFDPESERWCVPEGMPHVMDSAGPLDIIQGATEILIHTEHLGVPRHIYTDGRKHVSDDVFDHTSVGNSIGAWKGGVLTVDTVGFSKALGPFGAPRTEATHLVETFKVAGDKLAVTSTWRDPAVYAKPFVYTVTYERMPSDYTVDNFNCDPRQNGAYLPGSLR